MDPLRDQTVPSLSQAAAPWALVLGVATLDRAGGIKTVRKGARSMVLSPLGGIVQVRIDHLPARYALSFGRGSREVRAGILAVRIWPIWRAPHHLGERQEGAGGIKTVRTHQASSSTARRPGYVGYDFRCRPCAVEPGPARSKPGILAVHSEVHHTLPTQCPRDRVCPTTWV